MRFCWSLIFLLAIGLSPARSEELPEPSRPFQQTDYELAYDVFIKSGALKEALAVAVKALKNDPNNLEWRRKAGQAALWQGKSDIALRHFFFLALKGDPDDFQRALTLAQALHDYPKLLVLYRMQMKERPRDDQLFMKFIHAWSEVGKPERAIPVLWQRYRKYGHGGLLRELAELYRSIDQPERERHVLQLFLKRHSPQAWAIQRLASLELLRGNAKGAYRLLQKYTPRLREVSPELAGLHLELAWSQQDYATFSKLVQRYQETLSANQIARLILLDKSYGRLDQAFSMALRLWQQEPNLSSALMLLSIANQDKKGAFLDQAISALDQFPMEELQNHPLYFLSWAKWHQHHGRIAEAQAVLREGLAQLPDNLDLWLTYLWIMIDNGQADLLASWLPTLQTWALHNPKLIEPTVALLTALEKPEQALLFMRMQARDRQNDPLWLMNYADLLEQSGRRQEAQLWRVHSYHLLKNHPFTLKDDEKIALLRLLQIFGGGDNTAAAMLNLLTARQSNLNPQLQDLVLAWALSQPDESLARYWYLKSYWQRHQQPPLVSLNLAVKESDAQTIAAWLDYQGIRLSASEKLNAALNLKRQNQAINLAFDTLGQSPWNQPLAEQFQTLALEQSNNAAFTWRYENLQDAHWHQARLEINQQLTHRLRLKGIAERINLIDVDPTLWRRSKPRPGRYLLQASYRHRYGETKLHGGITQAQGQHPAFSLEHQLPAIFGLRAGLKIATGEVNRESVQLFLAGSAKEVSTNLDYALSQRQHIFARFGHRWFEASNGDDVGKGWLVDGSYRYLWRSRSPQIALRSSVQWRDYSAAKSLPGKLARHVPIGGNKNGRFMIPQDYTQVNIALDVNTDFETGFTPRLHPFFSIAGNWHSVNDFGGSIHAGLTSRLFGPDRLTLFFDRIKGGQGVQNDSLNLGLTYQIFF
ncbi:MAG: hypothetical protein AXA67_07095 [Methylothermaceae bacteria B42]|nr:MAG: hypothetical protein AXA67_07095 [Methylothermaceae bacteria B42]HHJ40209.1 tetratricopeptide repeat protein [Methylothermaceae bacterium]